MSGGNESDSVATGADNNDQPVINPVPIKRARAPRGRRQSKCFNEHTVGKTKYLALPASKIIGIPEFKADPSNPKAFFNELKRLSVIRAGIEPSKHDDIFGEARVTECRHDQQQTKENFSHSPNLLCT